MNKLTRARISVEALLGQIQSGERGGTCVFLGTVRNDGDVTAIDYSAYDEMAREEIVRLIDEAQARWPAAKIIVQHRLGVVPVGEASIAIVAAAPHREEALYDRGNQEAVADLEEGDPRGRDIDLGGSVRETDRRRPA